MRISWLRLLICCFIPIFSSACGVSPSRKPESVSLSWWHFWAEPHQKPIIDSLIAEFEQSNPTIRIQTTELTWANGHEKITAAFAGNRAPDVIELGSDWIPEYAQRGLLVDLTMHADSMRADFLGFDCGEVNRRVFAMPWLLGSRALFVNSDIISNEPFSTLDDMKQRICAVNRPGSGVYGFGSTKREPHHLYKKVLPFFWTMGGDILTTTSVEINSPENQRALSYYLDLCDCGMLESQRNLDDAFVAGRVAVVFSGGWLIRKIQEQNPSLNYRIEKLPSLEPTKPGISFFGGEYLAINRASEHPSEALEWIKFLIRPENSIRLSKIAKVVVPAARSGAGDPYFQSNPSEQRLFEQLLSSRPSPIHPKWNLIENVLEEEVEQAIFKVKTAERALVDAQNRVTRFIDQ